MSAAESPTPLQPPRGTSDLVSPESDRFAHVQALGARILGAAGFRRIVTPMFEDTAVFHRGVGETSDVVRKETYTFEDRANNSLTLRAEGTAPVMRAIISEHLWDEGLPIKVFYDAAMFRYERPQKGRTRQHHQLGVEAVGSDAPALDADVIATGLELLRACAVGPVRVLVGSMGHRECRAAYVPRFVAALEPHRAELSEDSQRRLDENPLRIWDSKVPRDIELRSEAPTLIDALCADCASHFESVRGFLDEWGIGIEIAPALVRGFDYYTRTTFEYASESLDAAQNALGGGGRYDGLVASMGGPDLPGIGFGIGIERVLLAQAAAGNAPQPAVLDLFVVPVRVEDVAHGMRVVRAARAEGLAADLAHGDRSLKAHLKHANRLGARFAGICGASETDAGAVTIRAMDSGDQATVSIQEAIGRIRGAKGAHDVAHA